jgi:hypothetical protein
VVEEFRRVFGDVKVLYVKEGDVELGDPGEGKPKDTDK